jgi:hypothetical protein
MRPVWFVEVDTECPGVDSFIPGGQPVSTRELGIMLCREADHFFFFQALRLHVNGTGVLIIDFRRLGRFGVAIL